MKYEIKDSRAAIVATVYTKDADTEIQLSEGFTSELVADDGGETGGGGPDPVKPD